MNFNFDTICAIATPLSTGGIGVIRISGEESFSIAQKIFNKKIKPKYINHGQIIDDNKVIDEVVLLPFVAPHSYTGEDVVEIQAHGSLVVVNEILNLVLKNGAKLAQRGEFTKRAFLNGKIDLVQAESVLDLINSKTQKSAQGAVNNLSKMLSNKIDKIKEDFKSILGKVMASIDFPEDVAELEYEEIEKSALKSIHEIEDILKNAKMHNLIRQGIKIAIVGRPNAGKSSLFNSLLNVDRAIVTDIEGTTRDVISETIEINGLSATLLDTAGIRNDSDDRVEQIGIEQSKSVIEESDIVLCLYDGTKGIEKLDAEIFEYAKEKPFIIVKTKADLSPDKKDDEINISSHTGFGIDVLKDAIYNKMTDTNIQDCEYLTNQRHQFCLEMSKESLENVVQGALNMELQDLICIDLKASLLALDEISGEVINDEILNNIFEAFCIGK